MFALQSLSDSAKSELMALTEASAEIVRSVEGHFKSVELLPDDRIEPGIYEVTADGAKVLLGEVELALLQPGDLIVSLEPVSGSVSHQIEFSTPCRFLSVDLVNELLASDSKFRDAVLKHLLCSVNFFSAISESAFICELPALPDVRTYPSGEKIISSGDTNSDVFIIISGCAEVQVEGQVVGELQSDEIFGALSAFTEKPRSADVLAKSDCTVVCLEQTKFHKLLESRPKTATKLVSELAKALANINEILLQG